MQTRILWADDEIEFLKPHILFLREKGYEVVPVTSGTEAVEVCSQSHFDIIFLDENMPGLSGLEALSRIKNIRPEVPVVMITKSEEEYLMEDAIGGQIADYLIKPVNPRQILSSIKKLLDKKGLVDTAVTRNYQQEFMRLSNRINDRLTHEEWVEVFKDLVFWDMQLANSSSEGMRDVLDSQFNEANGNFCNFVIKNYTSWVRNMDDAPLMSHTLLSKKLIPLLNEPDPVYVILIDNLRYDHWKAIQPKISELFRINEDTCYYGILPTATNYARNAIFAGMLPIDIEKRFPNLWLNDEEEGGKNLCEDEFLHDFLKRTRRDIKTSYNKITNLDAGRHLADNITNLSSNKLNVIIYNFVDLLSHVRTEMEVIKELAEDESAYRSLALSWFEHSPLYEILKRISERKANVIITTDHGSVRVRKPTKIVGDKNTTTNLRYKNGKNLNYEKGEVFEVRTPEDAGLPRQHVSSSYAFAIEDYFLVYPNNFNHFVNFYKNTFQHGGLSMEEMLIPIITMQSKE
ncbi:MAG: bifunctional response regulator/alkaline phosphatase family protein [Bacteroidetes bacterium]|nr:bifunctional response regulator/alkaline phosphatase family protein [Bacteroidota bacterium]